MSERRSGPDTVELEREERAFVERLASEYRAPRLSPARQVAFRQELDRRIGARVQRWQWISGAAVAAGVAAVLLVSRGDVSSVEQEPVKVARELDSPAAAQMSSASTQTTPEEALFSLAFEPLSDETADLPDDYEAIASLFLGS